MPVFAARKTVASAAADGRWIVGQPNSRTRTRRSKISRVIISPLYFWLLCWKRGNSIFFNVFMRYPQTRHDRSTEFRITPRIRTGNSYPQVGQRWNVAGAHGRSDRRSDQGHTRSKFRQRRYLLSERDVREKPPRKPPSRVLPLRSMGAKITSFDGDCFGVLARKMSTAEPWNVRETLNR